MELILHRTFKGPTYTIGKLYIDGLYFCDTLEDVDRGLTKKDNINILRSKKVYGETAIPIGEYDLDVSTISPKFKYASWAKQHNGIVPRLIDVPAYNGVLIHPGNDERDTDGCILVGLNKVKGKVINSIVTWNKLMQILLKSNNIHIIIK